jgi:C-terminal processing protease CtpA/Prc
MKFKAVCLSIFAPMIFLSVADVAGAAASEKTVSLRCADFPKEVSSRISTTHIVPRMGPEGKIDGWVLARILPGTLYEKLKLQVRDVIVRVDDETLDSPASHSSFMFMEGGVKCRPFKLLIERKDAQILFKVTISDR